MKIQNKQKLLPQILSLRCFCASIVVPKGGQNGRQDFIYVVANEFFFFIHIWVNEISTLYI